MSFVNKYLRNFTPYKVASHKIWTVPPEERRGMLKLDWNEATIPPSPKVGERLKALVEDGSFYNLYPATCNEQLLRLLSEYLELPEENIQYFASSDSLHEYIAKLYITVGDPVLLLGPTYDNFRLTAEVCGANIHYFNIDSSFRFDEEAFLRTVDRVEPSLIYICNPNNPTGNLHQPAFLRMLLERYPHILFLIDEAYAEFSGVSVKDLVLSYENLLISRTMSKAFALANFRFGYLIASKANIDYISNIRNPKNITTFAQEAAIGALSDLPYMRAYVEEVNRAGDRFEARLRDLSGALDCARGGNFVLLRLKREEDKAGLLGWLAGRGIYVRDVGQTDFLRRSCIRITVGTCPQMERVAQAIEAYFSSRPLPEAEKESS